MRKFFILLQKEIRELLTLQVLVPFLMVIVLLYFFGQYATEQAKKEQGPQTIAILDQSQTGLSRDVIDLLGKSNFQVEEVVGDQTALTSKMKEQRILLGLEIPIDFAENIKNLQPEKIKSFSFLPTFSITGATKYANLDKAIAIINEHVSNQYITSETTSDPTLLKSPISNAPHMIVKDRVAEANPLLVLNYLGTQAYFVPIILFLIIIFASQMIATSIASEKENKTLETLLTAPINRKMLVTAKMVGAGIVGLVLAGCYLIGFKSFIGGSAMNQISTEGVGPMLKSLNLVLEPQSYLLLGLVVFLGILVALSIAIILGAFAEDVKSVQGVIAPLMVLMMIPYFAVLFLDMNALPQVLKYIIYAIPFSHIFMAMPNLYLHNELWVLYGALYELVVFLVFVWLAAWIFSSDKIVTMKLNFSKKKKL